MSIPYRETPISWRVMLNKKLWNQEYYEINCTTRPESRRLPQSKGNGRMNVVPQMGESVAFVYNKKIVMRGIIDSNGFEIGVNHQYHSCNDGIYRPHAIRNWTV